MDKVNKQFINGMQSELDRKKLDYGGKDNPANYRNMSEKNLFNIIRSDIRYIDSNPLSTREYRKKLIAIANRCWMIWEKFEQGEQQ